MQRQELQSICEGVGLKFLGLVELGPEPNFERFQKWVEEGQHAGMAFIEQNQHLRADPRGLLPGAIQALVFALPYFQGDQLQAARRGAYPIAQYARLRDYHRSMRKKGEQLLKSLQDRVPNLEGRITIDSAPLLERSLAARTAEGFIGKNTCYIHPKAGSFFLLGEILLTRELMEVDKPADIDTQSRTSKGGCGSCRRCQSFCPTGALDKAYRLDARKCLAYWTIEHRGTIPFEFWPWLKTYLFGCDLCQLACPYNRGIPHSREPSKLELERIDLFEVATMKQARYEQLFGGSPLTRAKRSGLRRNALIAMTVKQDARLEEAIQLITSTDEALLHDTAAQIYQWLRR